MGQPQQRREWTCLSHHVIAGDCCAVVGLSNTGKSFLLRTLCVPSSGLSSTLKDMLSFYVDCNRMLDLSEQGFYEAVLRAIRSGLQDTAVGNQVTDRLERSYQQVVEPKNPLSIPLGFNDAMEALCEARWRVALLLDEFDEPFEALEGRTFLNLRALRDRYRQGLVYVTATERPLEMIRSDPQTAEFRELFAGRVCVLGMLEQNAARSVVVAWAAEEGVRLSQEESGFVVETAGGHPGLLRSVTRLLLRARTSAPQTYRRMGTALVAEALLGDEQVRGECGRLWEQLTAPERRVLLALALREQVSRSEQEHLERLGLTDGRGQVFSPLFAQFVRQRGSVRAGLPSGVWLDEETGEVYVEGRRAPVLTNLEYRLLSALYRRRGKLCDKYLLVEEVWGEAYIDQVDDARIEKLVSRVRTKIEDNPANPRYLVTVRGRGYRLLGPLEGE